MKRPSLAWFAATVIAPAAAAGGVEFGGEFAPSRGWVQEPEKPFRAEVCLNGSWQFQPVALPADFKRGNGEPPALPMPEAGRWDPVPIKIPSPWNVNAWGAGRNAGQGSPRPFWPDSTYFPSYPAEWDKAEMGWLRRSFRVPVDWGDRRIVLHFEAVAGECQVFLNGQPAGSHFDKYLPFELDITRLARRGADNELLVGVRAHALFGKQSTAYPKMRLPYPCGSATEKLAGIWQDVFLLGLPALRVADVFVKPWVDKDTLEVEVTLRNDGEREQSVAVGGEVLPWRNLAAGAEPRGQLEAPVLALPPAEATVAAGATARLVLRERAGKRLQLWAPGSPHLHAAVLSVRDGGRVLDQHSTRFGWRQFAIRGGDLLLNGQPIQLTGDFLHPFGPFVLSRSYVHAWYRMIQDCGGNSVRPHAQPHPRHFLDLADEMGLVLLDETAIFGSAISLNFEEPVAWERFAAHYDGLVLRDRNHPSVLGWSFGNELFAVFDHNNVPKDVADGWYRQLAELGARARRLDPTRDWISCDGDEDLRGTLPVWSKHFGHGTPLERLPRLNKPLMVGESGGTYYARPRQMAEFNGPRAYESYEGRNEALAIDVYDNIVRMARPRLAYYSASETAWFGIEHLNFGYRDFTRLPGKEDGVFFTRPFAEGRPGIQPERLPPYVAALNPGWDPELPPYKPLAMFHAQKAALAKAGPQPSPWSRRVEPAPRPAPPRPATIDQAGFAGDPDGPLARRLRSLGVPLAEGAQDFTLIEPGPSTGPEALARVREGGTALVLLGGAGAPSLAALGCECSLTDRPATALVPDPDHPWTASFALPDLYFAEDGPDDRFILRHGLAGAAVERGRVLLRASNTDWQLFNDAPEHAKCAAVVLYEQLAKPSGAALVEISHGKGRLLLCSIDWRVASPAANAFWRKLLTNAGVRLGRPAETFAAAFDERGALVNALTAGPFPAPSLAAALQTDFIGETSSGRTQAPKGVRWQTVECPSRDRFLVHQFAPQAPASGPFAVYLGCWLQSPRALDDLLAGGPDAPRLDVICYASEDCRLFLNGRELRPGARVPADYRTRLTFERVPLRKGWNQLLVKLASTRLRGDSPATLAVRIASNDPAYLRQVQSAVSLPPARR